MPWSWRLNLISKKPVGNLHGVKRIFIRSVFIGLGVGAVLIAINHGDALMAGEVSDRLLLKIVLTPIVPFIVSFTSGYMSLRECQVSSDK